MIRVGLAEKLDGLEFRLPSGSIVRTVEGEVVWKDGTPAANAQVIIEPSEMRTQTDEQGRFRFEGLTNVSYVITARARKEGKEPVEMHSVSRKIPAGLSVRDVKLILERR